MLRKLWEIINHFQLSAKLLSTLKFINMFSVLHKKNAHTRYMQQIDALEKELDLFIQSKSTCNTYSFPYRKLDSLIHDIDNITVHGLRNTLLETVQDKILSRLMQYEPKLYDTYKWLGELIEHNKSEIKKYPTYPFTNA